MRLQEVNSLVQTPWNHEPASACRLRESIQDIETLDIEFLLDCAAKLLLMWMMALEIELHHTESIDTLCGLKIQNLCCHSRTNGDWTRSSRSLLKFLALTELKFPSTTTKGRNSWWYVEGRTTSWTSYLNEIQDTIPRVRNYLWQNLLRKTVNIVLQSWINPASRKLMRSNPKYQRIQCTIRKKLLLLE